MLHYYKKNSDVKDLIYSTSGAACFDVHAFVQDGDNVQVFNNTDYTFKRVDSNKIILSPLERALIPTGIFFSIPTGYSVRFHPRSGFAIKKGISLVNCEGVIDSDYRGEVMITAINLNKDENIVIENGQRLCQGELVEDKKCDFIFCGLVKELQKEGDRNGGFGSTGF